LVLTNQPLSVDRLEAWVFESLVETFVVMWSKNLITHVPKAVPWGAIWMFLLRQAR
jgi:hypothetical protein